MKTYLALVGLLLCTSFHCLSQEPTDYLSSRNWVEDWVGGTNQTPEIERIFIASRSPSEYAAIVPYRESITLREVINQTRFQNSKLLVHVIRPNKSENKWFQNVTPSPNKSENEAFHKIAPLDTTDFQVQKGDVIMLTDLTPPLLI